MNNKLLANGQVLLERYSVKNYLSEGGMQQVFIADDLAFNRTVAVKVPMNLSAEKRFAGSARMSARITHANVAKTLDYFESEGSPFLVEEYVEGSDLDQLFKRRYHYFDPHLAGHFIHEIAKGLAAAHHAGVFHRDLKPSNIIVSTDQNLRTIKITDFGIARMAQKTLEDAAEGGTESLTGSTTAVGTLPYMAPEMINSPKAAAEPADVWAVGAILYRLLSSNYPYGQGLQAIPKIMEGALPPKPEQLSYRVQFQELGEQLWEIVQRCMEKDPSQRIKADELLALCDRLCYSKENRISAHISTFPVKNIRGGFLIGDDGSSYFFHQDSFAGRKPELHMKVSAAVFDGEPHPRAHPVLPIKG